MQAMRSTLIEQHVKKHARWTVRYIVSAQAWALCLAAQVESADQDE